LPTKKGILYKNVTSQKAMEKDKEFHREGHEEREE